MARKTEDIILLMDTEQATHSTLTALNSPSQTADYTLWKETIAQQLNYNEQLWDLTEAKLNALIANTRPGSRAWVQYMVLLFQYSAANPQILQLIDYVPSYPTIDSTLRIVTRCSVTTDLNKVFQIKVAKSDPPVALSALEYNSLVGYLNNTMFDGVDFVLVSGVADKLYCNAEVFYDGQYSSSIQTNVETAINAFLAAIPFNGLVKVSALQDAIQAVPGVTDVKLKTIKARQDSVVLASATTIYDIITSGTNALEWSTVAGYIIEEDTVGNTFSDTITYTVSS